MPALLDVRNLTVGFPAAGGGVTAVNDVSFAIAPGESLGLVGESGSGKSVTALAIMRLLVPQARVQGTIEFEARDLGALESEQMRELRGSRIAMIFQEPMTALNPVMRVGNQIAEAILAHARSDSGLRGLSSRARNREAWQRSVDALRVVAIGDPERRARDYPHQLSGGQRQRVMIAMAIVNRPRLLIADEPTTALDVTVQAQILELLAQLRAQRGLAMLFISHDLGVVSRVSDRIAVMFRGAIVETAPSAELLRNPQHPYTRGLLASVPSLKSSRAASLALISEEDRAQLNPEGALQEVVAGHFVRR